MLRDFFLQHGWEKTYWIAYSGGLDSHVLLSLCHQLQQTSPLKLRAIHINHNLSHHAKNWSQHCEKTCNSYGISLSVSSIQLDLNQGDSLEEVAREKRYAVLASYLQPGDMLLTAHHQNDQAETVLLQLLRGAGPKGLAAMASVKPLADGWHGRPLLQMTRLELEQYAKEKQLQWIEDESNQNRQLTRNFIRHDILPQLALRWPTVTQAMARSAGHCAEAQALLEEFAAELLNHCQGSRPHTLSVKKLLTLDEARQRLALRTWIKVSGFIMPDTQRVEVMQREVLFAAVDAMPRVQWGQAELRRYRDDLYLMVSLQDHDIGFQAMWDLSAPLSLAGVGILSGQAVLGQGLRTDIGSVSVRFRQGGEVVSLPGRGGRHTLKNLFQEWGVPTWERDRVPLLILGGECVGVVGYFVDAAYGAGLDEVGILPLLKVNPGQSQRARFPG